MFKHLSSKQQVQLVKSINRAALRKELIKKMQAVNPYYPSKHGKKKKPFTIVSDRGQKTIDRRMTGVRGGVSGKYFHYRFIEFGTKARYTRKRKAYRGAMPARPFLYRTIERSVPSVLNYFKREFSAQVKRRLDRMARKAA